MENSPVKEKKITGRPALRTIMPGMYCPGCHYGIITRAMCEVIEELGIAGKAIGLAGVGCSFGGAPMTIDVDWTSCPHGRAPAMATAIKRINPDAFVFTVQGDGDLGAIGLGCFMNALVRGEKLSTVFLNNAVYGTTGGQMAPTTLLGMKTTTSPSGRTLESAGYPLHVPELAATMKGVAYAARCSVHTPANFQKAKKCLKKAFKKQIDGIGYGIVEFVSACPPGWGRGPLECLDFISESMLSEYPLGEFKDVDKVD
ncbi:MAG: thiamine pyrophosphate-dependent enzyme [Thermodesulfobacteriota bacterium]|nr:thiamine pyrophosphate-dependent enzyme [Thermodesulfobacteriota bacterium]